MTGEKRAKGGERWGRKCPVKESGFYPTKGWTSNQMKGTWSVVALAAVENRTCLSRGVCACKWELGIRVNPLELADVDSRAGTLPAAPGWQHPSLAGSELANFKIVALPGLHLRPLELEGLWAGAWEWAVLEGSGCCLPGAWSKGHTQDIGWEAGQGLRKGKGQVPESGRGRLCFPLGSRGPVMEGGFPRWIDQET